MNKLLATLLLTTALGAQPLIVSNETAVSQPRLGMAALSVYDARLEATDGTTQLILWKDDRDALGSRSSNPVHYYVTRVDAEGHVLDVPNILIDMEVIGAFWDGHEYVIVGPGKYVGISSAGELLDPLPRTFTFTAHADHARLAWNGNHLLITNYSLSINANRYFSIYDGSLNVVKGDTLLRAQNGLQLDPPRIARSSKSFVILSKECFGLCSRYVDVIDADGNVLRSGVTAPPDNVLASDGRSYMMLSEYFASNNAYEFRGQLFDAFFGLIGNIGPFAHPASFADYDLAGEGDRYELVYVAAGSSFGLSALPVSGTLISTPVLLDSQIPHLYGIAAGGRPGARYALANSFTATEAFGSYSDWKGYVYGGNATATFTVGQGMLQQESPAVATIGNVSLLAWREPLSSARDRYGVFAARVDAAGHVLDSTPFRLATVSCDSIFPQIAASGANFLVVWQEPGGIRAQRIGTDGRLLDATPVAVSNFVITGCDGNQPALAWNGSTYLIAWTGPFGTPTGLNVIRMTPDGTILDEPPIDLGRGANFSQPRAASDGKNFLVSWTVTGNGFSGTRGVRITGDGALLDIPDFSLGLRSSTALAWDGTNYILLSSQADGLHSVRVTPGGQLLDFIAGQPGPAMKFPFDATSLKVTCGAPGCFVYAIDNAALVATRLDETPAGIAATSRTLANVSGDWKQAIPFGADLGQVAYLRLATEPPYMGVYHLFTGVLLPVRGRAVR